MLDEDGLGTFIDDHYKDPGDTLFRFEALPLYNVDSDGTDWQRWQSGATEPSWDRKQPWLDVLQQERDNGLRSSRVRLFSPQLTDYELYECHFAYVYNAQFEDIRVLRPGEHPVPTGLLQQDYWIVNDRYVLPMHYDDAGQFIGADVLFTAALQRYLDDRAAAWAVAEPFPGWWTRHPELHRRMAA